MAWLSVGTSNADLCEKLIENEILTEGTAILRAFQRTDRGDFIPSGDRLQAYLDRPYKKGNIHTSAPHMYVTVLEALDLRPGLSFLNVGSGSGYLSCLAAHLLGEGGLSHGIEVADGMAEYSTNAVKKWHEKIVTNSSDSEPFNVTLDSIRFVQGNCFDIDLASTVSTCRYDRIYVGAGCPNNRKEFFLSMLSEHGVLVVPINEKNEMVRMRKLCGSIYNQTHVSNVHFAPLVDTSVRPDEAQHIREAHGIQLREQRSRSSSLVCEPQYSVASSRPDWNVSSSAEPSDADVDMGESSSQLYDVLSAETSSFIIHPAPSLLEQQQHHHHHHTHMRDQQQSQQEQPRASSLNVATAAAARLLGVSSAAQRNCSAAAAKIPKHHRVCLPLLLWAPTRQRHFQFPRPFRKALFTVLMVNNRLHCSSSSSNHRPSRLALPHQMWLYIFSFANRQWFTQPKTEAQLLASELLVERRLRRETEQRLKIAEQARRRAEHERDLFRVVMMRMSSHLGSSSNDSSGSVSAAGMNTGTITAAAIAAATSGAFGDLGLEAFLQLGASFEDDDDEDDDDDVDEDVDEDDDVEGEDDHSSAMMGEGHIAFENEAPSHEAPSPEAAPAAEGAEHLEDTAEAMSHPETEELLEGSAADGQFGESGESGTAASSRSSRQREDSNDLAPASASPYLRTGIAIAAASAKSTLSTCSDPHPLNVRQASAVIPVPPSAPSAAGIKRSADILMPAPCCKQHQPSADRARIATCDSDGLDSTAFNSSYTMSPGTASMAYSTGSDYTCTTFDGGSNMSFRSSSFSLASSMKADDEDCGKDSATGIRRQGKEPFEDASISLINTPNFSDAGSNAGMSSVDTGGIAAKGSGESYSTSSSSSASASSSSFTLPFPFFFSPSASSGDVKLDSDSK